MAAKVRRPGPARLGLLLLLVMAAGFGVLAALLSAGVTSTYTPGAPASAASTPPSTWEILYTIVGYGAFAVFAIYIGYQVYIRIAQGRMPLPVRLALVGFVAILIGVLFVAAFHAAHVALSPGTRAPGANDTSSGQGTTPPGGNVSNNSSGVFGDHPIPSLPALTWFEVGVAGLFVAVLVAGILLVRMRPEAEGPRGPDPAVAARLRDELLESLRRLEEDPDADPREVILAVYHRLLLILGRRRYATETYTPREIGLVLVTEFGVRGGTTDELTQLFEIARYSTHPLGRPEAERARRAFRAILADLQPVGLDSPSPLSLEATPVTNPPRPPPPE